MKSYFYQHELRSVLSLSLIFGFRMLGLFMILPIFSVAAKEIPSATASLIGLALGMYGLTQAFFQIPLSMLSDYFGRKLIISVGLILFLIGSIVAAKSTSIYGIILGRAIQGTGAIGSVILALLTDVTKVENRTQAMAIIGMSIGFSFMLSILLGPVIYDLFSLSGLFWAMAIMALLGLFILQFFVKGERKLLFQKDEKDRQLPFGLLKQVIFEPELIRLNLGIFIQHAILTASFIAVPRVLSQSLSLPINHYWMFFLPIFLLALFAFPLIMLSERRRFVREALLFSVGVLAITQVLLSFSVFHASLTFFITIFSVFFFAFTLLEAFLPSLISKVAPIKGRGTAMGIYSTAQFLGIFLGGSLGGMVLMYFNLNGVFLFCGILGILWLLVAIPMRLPPYLKTRIYKVEERMTTEKAQVLGQQFLSVKGVSEAAVILHEGAVYLKVDPCTLNEVHLQNMISKFNVEKNYG